MAKQRITERDLKSLIDRINVLTNSPDRPYNVTTGKSNVGCFCMSAAYGGYNVERIVNQSGGVTSPLGGGYHPKRVIYDRLRAFILGLETRKD